jgi:hypothetical protein
MQGTRDRDFTGLSRQPVFLKAKQPDIHGIMSMTLANTEGQQCN